MEKFSKIEEYLLWPEYGSADLPEEAIQREYLMIQNEFNLQFQVGANTPLVSNGATQADSISCSNDSAFFPLEKSETRNIATSETADMDEINRKLKKRMADRKYRFQEKERIRKMDNNLKVLHEENQSVKNENESLKKERDLMSKDLQSANAQIKRLKTEISKLKRSIAVQEALVETFSHKVMNDDSQQEITRLMNKIDVLSNCVKWEDWIVEKEELLKRIVFVEHQNKVLRVQVEALCFKIIKSAEMDDEDKL